MGFFLFKHIHGLLFPNLCLSCLDRAAIDDQLFCVTCNYHMPQTDMHMHEENELTNRLIGIESISTGAALYLYNDQGQLKRLLELIKYKGRSDIALVLGRYYGKLLAQSTLYNQAQYIIPVPLHKNRFKQRGYNQSEFFARGLSEYLQIPVDTNSLIRIKDTSSQTKKSKDERISNVADAFELINLRRFENQQVILVDDVLTTGSTLVACANELKRTKNITVSVATLALRTYF